MNSSNDSSNVFLTVILTSVFVVAFVLLGGLNIFDPLIADAQTEDTTQITNPSAGEQVSGVTTLEAEYTGTTTLNSDGNRVSFAVRSGQCDSSGDTVFGNVDGQTDSYTYSTSTGEFSAELDTSTEQDGDYCFVFNPSDEEDTAEDEVNFVIANEIDEEDEASEVEVDVSKSVEGGDTTSSDFTLQLLDENSDPIQFSVGSTSQPTQNSFVGSADGTELYFQASSSATTYTLSEASGPADYVPQFAGADCDSSGAINIDPTTKQSYDCDITNQFTGTTTGTTTASIDQPEEGEVASGTTTLEATYNDGNDDNEGASFAVKSGTCEFNQNPQEGGEVVFGNVGSQDDPFNFDGTDFFAEFDTTTVADGDYCFIFNPDENEDMEDDVREVRDFTVLNDEPKDDVLKQCSAASVKSFSQAQNKNGNDVLAARSNAANVLGEEDMEDRGENDNKPPVDDSANVDYATLGFGGSITLEFDGNIPTNEGDDLRIYETSYPEDPSDPTESEYPETAEVAVSADGDNFETVGSVTLDGTVDIGDREDIQYVRITDTSDPSDFGSGEHVDGYDLAGIEAIHCEDDPEEDVDTINVMKHVCDPSIQSLEDFENFDGPDPGTTTEFHDKVLACPTVVMEGDEYTDGISFDGKRDFDFSITGDQGETQTIASSAYVAQKVCEDDIATDVNGDGTVSSSTCLDTSLYSYDNVSSGDVTVTETDSPTGRTGGFLEFTPSALNNGFDEGVTLDDPNRFEDGIVELNSSADTEDDTVTLHLYNLQDEVAQCEADEILHLAAGSEEGVNNGDLFSVDPLTGSSTLIESYEQSQFRSALATDQAGNLFTIRSSDENLVTLEPDGSVDTVGSTTGLSRPEAMMSAGDGQLLIADQSTDALYEVDASTGSTTQLHAFGSDLNVNGGDLEIAENGHIVYIHSNGGIYEIDPDNSYDVTQKGLLEAPTHITSLARIGSTYYALDRTNASAGTPDDDYYMFTLNPFSATQNTETGPFFYGDATRCVTDLGDEDTDSGNSSVTASSDSGGGGGALAARSGQGGSGNDSSNNDDNNGDVAGDRDDVNTDDDDDDNDVVSIQTQLDNARDQANNLLGQLAVGGGGPGAVLGTQDTAGTPGLPNTGDNSFTRSTDETVGWQFFLFLLGTLTASGLVYAAGARYRRKQRS